MLLPMSVAVSKTETVCVDYLCCYVIIGSLNLGTVVIAFALLSSPVFIRYQCLQLYVGD